MEKYILDVHPNWLPYERPIDFIGWLSEHHDANVMISSHLSPDEDTESQIAASPYRDRLCYAREKRMEKIGDFLIFPGYIDTEADNPRDVFKDVYDQKGQIIFNHLTFNLPSNFMNVYRFLKGLDEEERDHVTVGSNGHSPRIMRFVDRVIGRKFGIPHIAIEDSHVPPRDFNNSHNLVSKQSEDTTENLLLALRRLRHERSIIPVWKREHPRHSKLAVYSMIADDYSSIFTPMKERQLARLYSKSKD